MQGVTMDDTDIIRQYWMQTPSRISPESVLCSISSMLSDDPFEWVVEKAREQTRVLGILLDIPEKSRKFILDCAIEDLKEDPTLLFQLRRCEEVRDTFFP